jgi:hypothetical protein
LVAEFAGKTAASFWAKLMPPASSDDEVANEFNRLTSTQVKNSKLAGLSAVAELFQTGLALWEPEKSPVVELKVPVTDFKLILQGLTTVRTMLAEVLNLQTDADSDRLMEALHDFAELEPQVPADETEAEAAAEAELLAFVGRVFVVLGALQEFLLEAAITQ